MYVDVVVPLALVPLTFSISESDAAVIVKGSGVMVEIGKRKLYQGIVWEVHNRTPEYSRIKPIKQITHIEPLLKPTQMELWKWISDYYLCTLGEVMRVALPPKLKPSGFSEEEFTQDSYKARTKQVISLSAEICDEATLVEKFDTLKRSKAQTAALAEFLDKSGIASTDAKDDTKNIAENCAGDCEENCAEKSNETRNDKSNKARGNFSVKIDRSRLSAGTPILRKLEERGILVIETVEATADERDATSRFCMPELTAAQQVAYQTIEHSFNEKDTALLYGVTGSGKTEIYMRFIAEKLEKGEDVLYLVPEIALTAQLITRLELVFGDRVVAYHSRFTDHRRAEIFFRVGRAGGQLVIGARSSIFLPFRKLSLIIVDEEHDGSFKQTDQSPRYNARDCAQILSAIHGGKTVLGSATPSIESYSNATTGKYGYAELNERYADASMPTLIISDSRIASKRGERQTHFNKLLLDKIEQTLEDGRQVMLFQNKRGFSPYVECGECGWIANCPHCNVSLTLHKGEGDLRCHYCGHRSAILRMCPTCGQAEMESKGFGTEKVEEELTKIFPDTPIARLDSDTSRSKTAYERIIADFESGRTKILIGTQMITKGFDFSGVSLVGILNADNLLNYPDFRANERAFQLMTQVAGRSGRRDHQGEVVIQTSQSENPLIKQVIAGNYAAMVRSEMAAREMFLYPPYCRLISLTLKHRDKQLLWSATTEIDAALKKVFGRRILGPQPPPVDRIKGEYLICFIVKIERSKSFSRAKELIVKIIAEHSKRHRNIPVYCDVDPQ